MRGRSDHRHIVCVRPVAELSALGMPLLLKIPERHDHRGAVWHQSRLLRLFLLVIVAAKSDLLRDAAEFEAEVEAYTKAIRETRPVAGGPPMADRLWLCQRVQRRLQPPCGDAFGQLRASKQQRDVSEGWAGPNMVAVPGRSCQLQGAVSPRSDTGTAFRVRGRLVRNEVVSLLRTYRLYEGRPGRRCMQVGLRMICWAPAPDRPKSRADAPISGRRRGA